MEDEVLDKFEELKEVFWLEEGKGVRIDKEKMILYNVKFLGNKSENGHDYSDKAKRNYARLSEGEVINLNHSKTAREVESYGGNGRNKRVEADGVFGNWHYHRGVRELVEDAYDLGLTGIGMSLSGGGRLGRPGQNGRRIVEDYTVHHSTDFVTNPATTKSISEQTIEIEATAITPAGKSLDAEVKDKETKLNEEIKAQLADMAKQITELNEQLKAAEAARVVAEAKDAHFRMVQEAITASGKTLEPVVQKAAEFFTTKEEVVKFIESVGTTTATVNPPKGTGTADPLAEGKATAEAVKAKDEALMEAAFSDTSSIDVGMDYKLQGSK